MFQDNYLVLEEANSGSGDPNDYLSKLHKNFIKQEPSLFSFIFDKLVEHVFVTLYLK